MAYNNFGKGIKVTSGFDLSAKSPIDNRTLVDTLLERDAHVTDGIVYPGLKVFVVSEKKEYMYDGTGWVESGGITDEQLSQLTTAYAHSLTEHVSKETVEENFANINNAIDNLPTLEEVREMVDAKADSTHDHNTIYYTQTQVDEKIAIAVTEGKVDLSNYITQTQLTAELETRAPISHTHTPSDITGINDLFVDFYKKSEINEALTTNLTQANTHANDLITALKDNVPDDFNTLNKIASAINNHKAEYDSLVEQVDTKADSAHDHNTIYYTKDQVDEKVAKAVTDGQVDLTGYATSIDLAKKADIDHRHDDDYSDIEHTHLLTDIFDFSSFSDTIYKKEEVSELLSAKADVGHLHEGVYYTQTEVDQSLAQIELDVENTLKDYATQTQLTEGLETRARASHTHTPSEITGIDDLFADIYTKGEINEALATNLTNANTHADNLIVALRNNVSDDFDTLDKIETAINNHKTEYNNLVEQVGTKADSTHDHNTIYYTQAQVDEKVAKAVTDGQVDLTGYATLIDLAKKADSDHNHNNDYAAISHIHAMADITDLSNNVYTKTEVTNLLSAKAEANHLHDISSITDLQSILDSKASVESLNTTDANLKKYVNEELIKYETTTKAYTDEQITNLVDSAPDAMNTLNELASAINAHQGVYDAYVSTISTALSGKSDVNHEHDEDYATLNHTHVVENITGLFDVVYTKKELDDALAERAEVDHEHDKFYAPLSHDHNTLYYTISEVDEMLAGKADLESIDNMTITDEELDTMLVNIFGSVAE